MAMPQRDNAIRRRSASYGGQVEEIKRLDALLEYAVRPFPHLYKSENDLLSPKTRLREELKRLTDSI